MEVIWLEVDLGLIDIIWLGLGFITMMIGLVLGIAKGGTRFHKGLTLVANVLLVGVFVKKSQSSMRFWLILLGAILLISRVLLMLLPLLADLV